MKEVVIPSGQFVKLTKVASRLNLTITKAGDVMRGRLTKDVKEHGNIFLDTGGYTSPIEFILLTKDNDYIVVTSNSIYFMQIL